MPVSFFLQRSVPDFPANPVNFGQYFRPWHGTPRRQIFIELRHRRHTNEGAAHLPFDAAKGQRHLCRAHAGGTRRRVVAARGGQCLGSAPALLFHAVKQAQAANVGVLGVSQADGTHLARLDQSAQRFELLVNGRNAIQNSLSGAGKRRDRGDPIRE